MPEPIALQYGNNFYCSCERFFDASLIGKPVIILSNNDGCAVARSEEAKTLGINMGAPLPDPQSGERTWRQGSSSNYSLYGDFQRHLLDCVSQFSPVVEVYSIDENFIDLSGFGDRYEAIGAEMRATVRQHTGIPTCIGIGPTKTLAKLANCTAKKNPIFGGVWVWDDRHKPNF